VILKKSFLVTRILLLQLYFCRYGGSRVSLNKWSNIIIRYDLHQVRYWWFAKSTLNLNCRTVITYCRSRLDKTISECSLFIAIQFKYIESFSRGYLIFDGNKISTFQELHCHIWCQDTKRSVPCFLQGSERCLKLHRPRYSVYRALVEGFFTVSLLAFRQYRKGRARQKTAQDLSTDILAKAMLLITKTRMQTLQLYQHL
jgi:hypothetical protein